MTGTELPVVGEFDGFFMESGDYVPSCSLLKFLLYKDNCYYPTIKDLN